MFNSLWKTVGFQSEKPQRDFRGGGLMGLQTLIFFSKYHQYSVENIKTYCSSNDSFLFACVVISTVFWLKRFFHFDGDELTLLKDIDAIRATRKGLKFFLSFHHVLGSNNVYSGEESNLKSQYSENFENEKKDLKNNSENKNIDQSQEFRKISNALFDNNKEYLYYF